MSDFFIPKFLLALKDVFRKDFDLFQINQGVICICHRLPPGLKATKKFYLSFILNWISAVSEIVDSSSFLEYFHEKKILIASKLGQLFCEKSEIKKSRGTVPSNFE